MATGGFDYDSEVRRRVVDLAAAVEEIAGHPGYKAILDLIEGLEEAVLNVAVEDDPDRLTTYRGQVRALRSIREALASLRSDARTMAEEEQDEETAERLGLNLGKGDFAG